VTSFVICTLSVLHTFAYISRMIMHGITASRGGLVSTAYLVDGLIHCCTIIWLK